jgi:hypothetical protein
MSGANLVSLRGIPMQPHKNFLAYYRFFRYTDRSYSIYSGIVPMHEKANKLERKRRNTP